MGRIRDMLRINRELLPMKVHYFCYSAAEVMIQPYLVVYLQQLGASATEIGVVYTALPFALMICKPAFGSLADRLQKVKLCAIVLLFLTVLTYFAIKFTPDNDISHSVFPSCNSSGLFFDFCDIYPQKTDKTANATCRLSCLETNASSAFSVSEDAFVAEDACCSKINWKPTLNLSCANDVVLDCKWRCESEICLADGSAVSRSQMAYVFVFMIISYSVEGSALSLTDSITIELLGDNYSRYGFTRLFSSIGYGIFSIVIGQLVDTINAGQKVLDLSVCFYLMALFYFLSSMALFFVRDVKFNRSKNIFKDIFVVLIQPDQLLFAVGCFFLGIFAGITWTFLVVFMDELQMTKLMMGFALAIEGFGGEVIVFIFSGYILKTIGTQFSLTVVFVTYCVRFLAYSYITVPEYILPVELTEGFCFGLLMPALTTRAGKSVDPNVAATMQGAIQGIYEGIGVGVGGIVGGVLFDNYGSHMSWRILGISSGICAVVHFFLSYISHKRNSSFKRF